MPTATFDPFRAELAALRDAVSGAAKKTVRDDGLRERFRMLFRTWHTTVQPEVGGLAQSKKAVLKLGAEIEAVAKLASKCSKVVEYRKRLSRAISLANDLILYVPTEERPRHYPRLGTREDLFIPGIPDLSVSLVPNPLLGWRARIAAFVAEYPFDRSVFVMIRYRRRNDKVIAEVKRVLSENGYNGILASEHNLTGDLYNPIACLLCCSKGIAVFDEPEAAQAFNPNVAYELGMLHLLGRESLILKHKALKALHTDILPRLYQEYGALAEVAEHTSRWIAGLSKG